MPLDADCCSFPVGIRENHNALSPIQACINISETVSQTALATEPAYPAHHKQLSPHPLLR